MQKEVEGAPMQARAPRAPSVGAAATARCALAPSLPLRLAPRRP